ERPLAQLLPHPRFHSVRRGHDLSLVRMTSPVTLGDSVGTICLPLPHLRPPFGQSCWVTRWGNVGDNGEIRDFGGFWGVWGHLGIWGHLGCLGTLGK
ncbi:TRYB1 Tryptase, partial [Grantiella picta]|nr:TRYB1 Tryptase [Grantiella picta]